MACPAPPQIITVTAAAVADPQAPGPLKVVSKVHSIRHVPDEHAVLSKVQWQGYCPTCVVQHFLAAPSQPLRQPTCTSQVQPTQVSMTMLIYVNLLKGINDLHDAGHQCLDSRC
jgi:hypothetical protein